MKEFFNSAFALLMALVGLMAIAVALVGWADPEGVDLRVMLVVVIFAVVSFTASWISWKSSR